MTEEKVLELLKDEGFLEELGKTESAEEAQKLFASKGVEISIDELLALRARLKQAAGKELNDEELALVAGGGGEDRDPLHLNDLITFVENAWDKIDWFLRNWRFGLLCSAGRKKISGIWSVFFMSRLFFNRARILIEVRR
jgi:hypothetical protein